MNAQRSALDMTTRGFGAAAGVALFATVIILVLPMHATVDTGGGLQHVPCGTPFASNVARLRYDAQAAAAAQDSQVLAATAAGRPTANLYSDSQLYVKADACARTVDLMSTLAMMTLAAGVITGGLAVIVRFT